MSGAGECLLLDIPETDIRVGDVILGYWLTSLGGSYVATPMPYEVVKVARTIEVTAGGATWPFHTIGTGVIKWRVERRDDEDTQPGIRPAPVPAAKKVPDWPLRCPRCGKANSAVLLFQSWDCKHGCYGTKPLLQHPTLHWSS